MDISNCTLAELKDLMAIIPAEISRRMKAERSQALAEIRSVAAQRGFSLEEVIQPSLGGSTVRKPVAVKYRDPNNADLQWTGRGRKPRWVVDFIERGGDLSQLAVD